MEYFIYLYALYICMIQLTVDCSIWVQTKKYKVSGEKTINEYNELIQ